MPYISNFRGLLFYDQPSNRAALFFLSAAAFAIPGIFRRAEVIGGKELVHGELNAFKGAAGIFSLVFAAAFLVRNAVIVYGDQQLCVTLQAND